MSKPKFTKRSVEQTIDLKELFGVDFSNKRSLREAIGGAILERIRARTLSGQGVSFSDDGRGRSVTLKAPYSKEYAKSLEFKAAGKSRGNVNMTLTGDMLGLMDIKRQSGNTITIGWNDADENAKAYNHSVGDTVPRRPFFGVSKSELNEIKKQFGSEIKEAAKAPTNKEFEDRIAQLLSLVGGDGES